MRKTTLFSMLFVGVLVGMLVIPKGANAISFTLDQADLLNLAELDDLVGTETFFLVGADGTSGVQFLQVFPTLTGEITTGGLTRADADTTTHAVGTATTLVEHTYTATATHTNVQMGALFDANSAGTMGIIYLFTAATLVNNDTLKVSVTVTLND